MTPGGAQRARSTSLPHPIRRLDNPSGPCVQTCCFGTGALGTFIGFPAHRRRPRQDATSTHRRQRRSPPRHRRAVDSAPELRGRSPHHRRCRTGRRDRRRSTARGARPPRAAVHRPRAAAGRTELVTNGPYSLIRNPIYAAAMATAAGLTLAVPSSTSFVGLTMVVGGSHWQVRRIEEPYLQRVHPRAFPAYAGRVGRFLPRRPP